MNPTCVYCGRRATCHDHIWPKSRGGGDQESNRVPACHECNSSKGSKLITEWIPGRVLRAVALEPKVYAELLRIRAEDERQLAARHLAAAEVAAEARAATLTDIVRTRRPIGLREAIASGVIPIPPGSTPQRWLEAVRKARQKDPEFPAHLERTAVGELLYSPIELQTWLAWRPSTLRESLSPAETPLGKSQLSSGNAADFPASARPVSQPDRGDREW